MLDNEPLKLSIDEYLDTFSENARPSRKTIIRWLTKGELDGVKIGRRWFVLQPSGGGPVTRIKKVEAQPDVNKLAQRILGSHGVTIPDEEKA